jgi:hypothetical protein
MFDTPILVLGFNRPDYTQQVFDRLKTLQPKQLFVAVDGPRSNKRGEREKTRAVQEIFLTQMDWDCDLKTLFRTENFGCRDAVSGAISWFFEQVPEGIILEDDCVPHLSFFQFCAELLDYYREDERVMHIGGYRPPDIPVSSTFSYSFSKQALVWGWATWAEKWNNKMDLNLTGLPQYIKNKSIDNYIKDANAQYYIIDKWQETFEKRNSSWAYAWVFSIADNKGVSIIPNINLISNIGFGAEATNTKEDTQGHITNPAQKIKFPLIHPPLGSKMSQKEREKFEQAIFYKVQKSKWGLIRRRWIPAGVLSTVKRFLDRIN